MRIYAFNHKIKINGTCVTRLWSNKFQPHTYVYDPFRNVISKGRLQECNKVVASQKIV